jgi:hypothetical protein
MITGLLIFFGIALVAVGAVVYRKVSRGPRGGSAPDKKRPNQRY